MQVGQDEEGVNSPDMHVKDFDPETGVVKHLFAQFDYEAGFRYIVSSQEEARNELKCDG